MTHPFEVVGEMTMKLGEPEPAFPREPHDQEVYPTGAVTVGGTLVGEWDDNQETPMQAVGRLNGEFMQERAEHQRVVDQLDAARGTIEQRDTMLADTRRELARARRELDEFKATVREVAIRVADEQNWCLPGLNAVLRELDLPEKVTRWRVPVTVTATQTVWVSVTADTEDNAFGEVDDDDVRHAVDRNDWNIADWDPAEYQYVEADDED